MALSIIKSDSRGAYRLVAQEDLYLDETQTRIIIVRDGEEVPKEAAFVLAGKGGTIPTRYTDMLKALDVSPEVKDELKEEVEAEVKAKSQLPPPPQPSPQPQPKPEVKADAKAKLKPESPKSEPVKENAPA